MNDYKRYVFNTLVADEYITIEDGETAPKALNEGLDQAKNDICVIVHQDVIFPFGWERRLD